jgi:O-antigen ligase
MSASRRLEIGLLVALCLTLPLVEAPKNLAWLGYTLVWLWNRAAARDFGGRWDLWDSLIALWMASGFVVAAFAALHGAEWHAALDIVRYAGVLWLLKRSRLSEREIEWVLGALVASALVGLAVAYSQLWSGKKQALELNSVGHVNHSAIYLALMFGLCVSWLFSGRRRLLAIATSVFVLVSLFVTASRGGVAVGLLTLVALSLAWWPRSRLPLLVCGAVLAASVLVAVLGGAEVFEKHEENVQAGHPLAYRSNVWGIALDTWQQHPWFGVGMGNFELVTRTQADPYRNLFPHAHSLYLNSLAERGVVGAAPLAAVLIAWPLWLLRRRPARTSDTTEWVLWGAAAGAWIVTAVGGAVNTTLHHEHALLAALLLGLWLGRLDRR